MDETSIVVPLPQRSFAVRPWKNGGGVATDIAGAMKPSARSDDWDGLLWRFGRTSIVRPGPFSDLRGYRRLQMVIEGRGLMLDHVGGCIDLAEPLTVASYYGGLPVTSRLLCGPVEVLNLIADDASLDSGMSALSPGSDAVVQAAATVVAYALPGGVSCVVGGQSIELPAGDAAQLALTETARIHCASGLLVIAWVRPRSA